MTFTKGVLTGAIPWHLLEKQYFQANAYRDEVLRLIDSEDSAFRAGMDFAHQMDRVAEIDELKAKEFLNTIGENQNDTKNKLLKNTLVQDDKIGDLEALTKQIGNEEAKKVDQKSQSSSNSILESLNLPMLSSLSSKIFVDSIPEASKSSHHGDKPMPQYMLPKLIRNDGNQSEDPLHREAVMFMRGIMDECTHLKNYDVPVDTNLIYIVIAGKEYLSKICRLMIFIYELI